MSADPEKVTFGAIVEHAPASTAATMLDDKDFKSAPQSSHPYMAAQKNGRPSTNVTTHLSSRPTSSDTMTPTPDHDPANPFSAFYEHPHARRSAEDLTARTQPRLLHPNAAALPHKHAHVTESDIESGLNVPVSAATTQTNLSGMPHVSVAPSKECTMWPSRQTLLEQRKAEKRSRRGRCDCLGRLNKRQKLLVQILVALLVVGAAVGVGVGISRAVGGGVWAGNGQTKQLPQDHDN